MSRSHILAFRLRALALCSFLLALPARAQLGPAADAPAPPTDQPTPEETLQSGAGLVKRAKAGVRELERIRTNATRDLALEALYDRLPTEREELAERVAAAQRSIRTARRAFELKDIRFAFSEDQERIGAWAEQVGLASAAIETGKRSTLELLKFWERANKLARDTGAPREVREQTERVIEEARRTQLALTRPEAIIIPLQSTIDEMGGMVDSVLEATESEGPDLLDDAHRRDFSVLTNARWLAELERLGAATADSLEYLLSLGARFVVTNRDRLTAHALFTGIAFLGMLVFRRRARDWQGEERPARVAQRILKHPVSGALLLSMVVGGVFYDELPTTAVILRYGLAVGCALVLFLALVVAPVRRLIYAVSAFLCVDLLRLLWSDLVHLERLLLTLELACAASVLGYFLGQGHWPALPYQERWTGLRRTVAWIWLACTSLGALAALSGFGYFAEIVGGGALVSMYLALIIAAAVDATAGLIWIVTQHASAQKLHVIAKHRQLVLRRVSGVLALAAMALWVWLSLEYLTLADVVWQNGKRALEASLEVGTLKLSFGLVIVIGLGIALAIYCARLIRFLLDEDVLVRFEIAGNSRELLSSSFFYAVLLIGFFVTLAAAGIPLDKLTVVLGALGVGIGFGLQNVVQNLVAGLLLLFGGPIKVRDKIQLADLTGEVTSIGFRASTVRTWQGAEVIVPNAKLIADQVINWTLSDQRRRIDLDIGVKYGTDPERVIQLLVEVGRAHPKVLAEPPVQVFFLKHGESSLDFQLRAWAGFDDYVGVLSELTIAVNKRLVAEHIEIPFPQRDLHLASIAPEVASTLLKQSTQGK